MLAPDASQAVPALESNLCALWSRFGRGRGCCLHEDAEALWYETPIPTLPYNGVLRFTAAGNAGPTMDRIFARFQERKVPFVWMVHPSAAPADIGDSLRARGLEEAEVADGMWADLTLLPRPDPEPAGIEIREVTSVPEVDAVLDLVQWRWNVRPENLGRLRRIAEAFEFGIPGSAVRCWIAWQDGAPVAKAMLNLAEGAAGLYAVATRPESRGRGLGRTLALRAFAAARSAGYRLGVLHSTPMARSLYATLGFRSIAPFRIFAPPQSLHI